MVFETSRVFCIEKSVNLCKKKVILFSLLRIRENSPAGQELLH